MDGRICLVTGANSGIGLETARGLAAAGATVVMACRNRGKAEAARDEIAQSTGSDRLELLDLDLASFASIRAAAAEFQQRHDALHVLVNNAGLLLSERTTTEEGFEGSLGINHVGHFLLTDLLLDTLKASAPSRVVTLSSDGHRMAARGLVWDDLMYERRSYAGLTAYCESKLANLMFASELARRLEGTGVTSYSVHPGGVASNFTGGANGWFRWVFQAVKPFLITPAKGARTSLHCATADPASLPNGGYFTRSKPKKPSGPARDVEAAVRLWTWTEELISSV